MDGSGRINGGLLVEQNATSPNLIGGFSGNSVTSGVVGASIGGGGMSSLTNRVTDDGGTVGGGRGNQAGDGLGSTSDKQSATVGGGQGNTASGNEATVGGGLANSATANKATIAGGQSNSVTDDWGTVGGGQGNTASDFHATVGGGQGNTASGIRATIAGGIFNLASGTRATIGGGGQNTASGVLATVPGGSNNTAQGSNSFAAGFRAKALHDGTFVWGDSSNADVASTAANQFIARASGGVTFFTDTGLTTGVTVGAGGGSWSSVSDRNLKENFAPVEGQSLLARLNEIPIETWNYKTQDDSIRHLGPMAQDFRAAFGLGSDDKHISTVDADGVALAAIQALYRLSLDKDAQLRKQQAQIQEQQALLQELQAELAVVKAQLTRSDDNQVAVLKLQE